MHTHLLSTAHWQQWQLRNTYSSTVNSTLTAEKCILLYCQQHTDSWEMHTPLLSTEHWQPWQLSNVYSHTARISFRYFCCFVLKLLTTCFITNSNNSTANESRGHLKSNKSRRCSALTAWGYAIMLHSHFNQLGVLLICSDEGRRETN